MGSKSLRDIRKRSSRRRSKKSTERRNSPHRNISPTGLDTTAWIKEKHEQEQQEQWEISTTTIKERKPHHIMNTNSKMMTRRAQVVISRLRTGFSRATHSAMMDKEPSPECRFCAVNHTTDHFLWHCRETETERLQIAMEKLIKYVKEIGFFDGIKKNRKIICRKKSYALDSAGAERLKRVNNIRIQKF
jgi:hypothetical protein